MLGGFKSHVLPGLPPIQAPVYTVSYPDMTATDLREFLRENDISGVPVQGPDGEPMQGHAFAWGSLMGGLPERSTGRLENRS